MNYLIGCNYWASNAGTDMWVDFDEAAIENDLTRLSGHGIRYLRVFPNWRDFQPVHPVYTGGQIIVEYRLKDDREARNPEYLDEEMLRRFGRFCDLCEKHGLKMIVGLITGWMSGRLFIPPALYGKDLYRDSTALLFEMRLCGGIVRRFRDKPAIFAWDLGNECNCMGSVTDENTATAWTRVIADTIRANDPTRPVISGMHSLTVDASENAWTIRGQAEAVDILTTHPYPLWVRHTDRARIESCRTMLHATCETQLYADLSGKPCLVEETGTMGPMICDEETAARFWRVNLFSNLTNRALGVMWWCANDQTNLEKPPYSYQMIEQELGLLRTDGTAKPVLLENKRLAEALDGFDFELLPVKPDAVCILSRGQDQWAVGYMTYCIAKQAGLNIRFADDSRPLPEAETYLLPSISGYSVLSKGLYAQLRERAARGATLYISNDDGVLAEFEALTGLRVTDSEKGAEQGQFSLNGESVRFTRNRHFRLRAETAQILWRDEQGDILAAEHRYGEGKVIYLNFPMEKMLIGENGAFEGNYHRVYRALFREQIARHPLRSESPSLGVTVHDTTDGRKVCVAVNYGPEDIPWRQTEHVKKLYYGKKDIVPAYDALVFEMKE